MIEYEEDIKETQREYAMRITERRRLKAYSDPSAGSDRYFAEASRLDAMGEDGQISRDLGIARYAEIKAMYPWPELDE